MTKEMTKTFLALKRNLKNMKDDLRCAEHNQVDQRYELHACGERIHSCEALLDDLARQINGALT